MRIKKFAALLLATGLAFSANAHAQGAAPEMFGVREVVVEYARFDDPKAAEACGLTRENIASTLAAALNNTGVPAVAVTDARPLSLGVARIQLVPEIYAYANESLDCVSWVSLTAENRVSAVIPPVPTLRSVNVVYWQQHTKIISGQSIHQQRVTDTLQKMVAQFVQQYKLDQPPEPK